MAFNLDMPRMLDWPLLTGQQRTLGMEQLLPSSGNRLHWGYFFHLRICPPSSEFSWLTWKLLCYMSFPGCHPSENRDVVWHLENPPVYLVRQVSRQHQGMNCQCHEVSHWFVCLLLPFVLLGIIGLFVVLCVKFIFKYKSPCTAISK